MPPNERAGLDSLVSVVVFPKEKAGLSVFVSSFSAVLVPNEKGLVEFSSFFSEVPALRFKEKLGFDASGLLEVSGVSFLSSFAGLEPKEKAGVELDLFSSFVVLPKDSDGLD